MANLVKRLSLPEAIGLSVSVICPTVTAAFNITLVVQAAGAAAPLAFAIGTVAMVLVALSFMAFTHRVATPARPTRISRTPSAAVWASSRAGACC